MKYVWWWSRDYWLRRRCYWHLRGENGEVIASGNQGYSGSVSV